MTEEEKLYAQYFLECGGLSCDRATQALAAGSKKYQVLEQRQEACAREIRALVGDRKKLLREWEDTANELAAMETDCTYWQGFRDCAFLLRHMGLLDKDS